MPTQRCSAVRNSILNFVQATAVTAVSSHAFSGLTKFIEVVLTAGFTALPPLKESSDHRSKSSLPELLDPRRILFGRRFVPYGRELIVRLLNSFFFGCSEKCIRGLTTAMIGAAQLRTIVIAVVLPASPFFCASRQKTPAGS